MKNLCGYQDLHSNTLLLAVVFEIFCDKCFKTYGLDPVCFCSASGLGYIVALRIT